MSKIRGDQDKHCKQTAKFVLELQSSLLLGMFNDLLQFARAVK